MASVNRGRAPRDFALAVFGGRGSVHGVALMEAWGKKSWFRAERRPALRLPTNAATTTQPRFWGANVIKGLDQTLHSVVELERDGIAANGLDLSATSLIPLSHYRYQNQEFEGEFEGTRARHTYDDPPQVSFRFTQPMSVAEPGAHRTTTRLSASSATTAEPTSSSH